MTTSQLEHVTKHYQYIDKLSAVREAAPEKKLWDFFYVRCDDPFKFQSES